MVQSNGISFGSSEISKDSLGYIEQVNDWYRILIVFFEGYIYGCKIEYSEGYIDNLLNGFSLYIYELVSIGKHQVLEDLNTTSWMVHLNDISFGSYQIVRYDMGSIGKWKDWYGIFNCLL